MSGSFKPLVRAGLLLLVALATWIAWEWHRYASAPLALPAERVRIDVPRGTGVRGIAAELKRAGIPVAGWRVVAASRLRGDGDRLKAGTYELVAPTTLKSLLDQIGRGDVLLIDIRFIEGWTFRQLRAAIDAHPDLAHDTRSLAERELMARVGATERSPEGLFYPDTYRFTPGASDLEIYRVAYRRMKKALDDAWAARAPDLPLATPYDALVLASIVEKETGRESDRDKVAAVFLNRLRKGMLLQSDPTTIYGLGERFDGNLRRRDLQSDTEYNTYTRTGLPPTPISLPGRASLVAVTRPARIDALYFVSRGDGTSEFSDDLAAHNRAVSRYQLKPR